MKLSEIIKELHRLAPLASQESYDNSGLIIGKPDREVKKALISLDCTEKVVAEAKRRKCDLIISHHPIIFKGIKKLTGETHVERTIMKAIQHDISIFAMHTNLDNSLEGVNRKIGEKIGIKNPKILLPKAGDLVKVSVFCPPGKTDALATAMFDAGAGNIGNYAQCSFSTNGMGTFFGNKMTKPVVGKKNRREKIPEIKLEVVTNCYLLNGVLQAMKNAHPYEEVAFDCYNLLNTDHSTGSGMIGELPKSVDFKVFMRKLKSSFKCGIIRFAGPKKSSLQRIAWCGGSGSFLIEAAIANKADIFITGDVKYHDFFRAEDKIIVADIGHYESEQFTIQLLGELLQKKFPTFAACFTETNTNPVQYF